MSLGKYKLKQERNATKHLLEWSKSGTLMTPNVGRVVEQQELSFVAGGNANVNGTLCKTVWQFLTKLKLLL